jgi:hypothetical protein
MDSELQALIDQLDPKADYGESTYEAVRNGVLNGDVVIGPGHGRPTLRDKNTGLTIKGTGKPISGNEASKRQKLQQRLLDSGEQDFPTVYAALMDAVNDGDVRAIKLWMEMVIGRADIMKATSDTSVMEKLVDALVASKQSTVREVIIEQ